ncbi:S8 family serine peptidase [Streptomyces sp. NBC_00370]|uniref:S8 family serine peptidase n=1 Tax=Streptomyces sp. NBC_00370 TaxID=2975728 RepID=UPI002E277302
MAVTTQTRAPWGLARISHRPKLNVSTMNKYEHHETAGEGVDVYILSTGVNVNHEDFEGRASWEFGQVIEYDDQEDIHGRGTQLAGIVAGQKHGVAKRANIIAMKVSHAEEAADTKTLIEALKVSAEKALQLRRPSVILLDAHGANSKNAELDAMVNTCVSKGIFVVVPAGDDNQDVSDHSPAGASGAFTVGSSTLSDERSPSSNYGPAVDIFAPGDNIVSTVADSNNNNATGVMAGCGTPQAAAHAAGLAAYLLSTSADVTTANVRDAITALATKDALTGVPEGTSNLLAFNNASTA